MHLVWDGRDVIECVINDTQLTSGSRCMNMTTAMYVYLPVTCSSFSDFAYSNVVTIHATEDTTFGVVCLPAVPTVMPPLVTPSVMMAPAKFAFVGMETA